MTTNYKPGTTTTNYVQLEFPELSVYTAPSSTGIGAPKTLEHRDYWKPYFKTKFSSLNDNTLMTRSSLLLSHLLDSSTLNPGTYSACILDIALNLRSASNPSARFFDPVLSKFDLTEEVILPNIPQRSMYSSRTSEPSDTNPPVSDSDSLDNKSYTLPVYDSVSDKILKSMRDETSAAYIGPIVCCALLGGASRQAQSTAARIVRLLKNLTNFFPKASPTLLTELDLNVPEWVNKVKTITDMVRGCAEYRQFAAICAATYLHAQSGDGAYKAIRMCALMLYQREGYGAAFMMKRLADRYAVEVSEILDSCGIGSMLPDIKRVIAYMTNYTEWVKRNKLENEEKYKQSYYFCRAIDDEYDSQMSGSLTSKLQALLAYWIDRAEGTQIYQSAFVHIRQLKLSQLEESYAEDLYDYFEKNHNIGKGTRLAQKIRGQHKDIVEEDFETD